MLVALVMEPYYSDGCRRYPTRKSGTQLDAGDIPTEKFGTGREESSGS